MLHEIWAAPLGVLSCLTSSKTSTYQLPTYQIREIIPEAEKRMLEETCSAAPADGPDSMIPDCSLLDQYLKNSRDNDATSTPTTLITKKVFLGVSLHSPLSNSPYLVPKE